MLDLEIDYVNYSCDQLYGKNIISGHKKIVNVYSDNKFKVIYNFHICATFGKNYHIDELLRLSKTIPKLNENENIIFRDVSEIPNHLPKINVHDYNVNGYMDFIKVISKNPFYIEIILYNDKPYNLDNNIYSIKHDMITKLKFINAYYKIGQYFKNPEKFYQLQSNSITIKIDKIKQLYVPSSEII